jgi:hypothetical protein
MGETFKAKVDYYVRGKGFFTTTLTVPNEVKKISQNNRTQVVLDYLCDQHKIHRFSALLWYQGSNPIEIITGTYLK